MNNREKYNDDILRQYIGPERIEKAPEGFTSKVMTRIKIETIPSAVSVKSQKRNLIPVISAAVTLLLLAAAFLIPVSESDSITIPLLRLFAEYKIITTRIKPGINLPANPSVSNVVCLYWNFSAYSFRQSSQQDISQGEIIKMYYVLLAIEAELRLHKIAKEKQLCFTPLLLSVIPS